MNVKAKFVGKVSLYSNGVEYKTGGEYTITKELADKFSKLFEVVAKPVAKPKAEPKPKPKAQAEEK